jgi:hypothetical protein
MLNTEDRTEIARAGRRCSVCRSGRGWRKLEVLRRAVGEPVVLCASCRARVGDQFAAEPAPAPEPEPAPAPPRKPSSPKPRAAKRRGEPRPDRLQAALGKLPSPFSTAMAARTAGLNKDKIIARLEELERHGQVRRVGKRWTTEAAPTDLSAAIDRLEAQTSNLRIVRDRARVG